MLTHSTPAGGDPAFTDSHNTCWSTADTTCTITLDHYNGHLCWWVDSDNHSHVIKSLRLSPASLIIVTDLTVCLACWSTDLSNTVSWPISWSSLTAAKCRQTFHETKNVFSLSMVSLVRGDAFSLSIFWLPSSPVLLWLFLWMILFLRWHFMVLCIHNRKGKIEKVHVPL